MESRSVVALGATSNSEFSEMVWSMSRSLPKLEKGSSEALPIGLPCLPDGPRGDAGLGDEKRAFVVVPGTGEECARAICGARSTDPEDFERPWPRGTGERGRGCSGNVEAAKLEKGYKTLVASGAVARWGDCGLLFGEEDEEAAGGAGEPVSVGGGKGSSLLVIMDGSDTEESML